MQTGSASNLNEKRSVDIICVVSISGISCSGYLRLFYDINSRICRLNHGPCWPYCYRRHLFLHSSLRKSPPDEVSSYSLVVHTVCSQTQFLLEKGQIMA